MLTKKQVRTMKIVGKVLFALAFFSAMLVSLSIINGLGNYEKSAGSILITAFGATLIFTTEYVLVRKPLLCMIEKNRRKGVKNEACKVA